MSKKFFYPTRNAGNPYEITLVEIPEEIYRSVQPEIDKTRKRMQRGGFCVCPKSKLWMCDADCALCRFRSSGNSVSLSEPTGDEDLTVEDALPSDCPTPEDIAADKALLEMLCEELEKLDPDGRRICELMKYHSERVAAQLMGISRTAFKYRWGKIKTELRKKLSE